MYRAKASVLARGPTSIANRLEYVNARWSRTSPVTLLLPSFQKARPAWTLNKVRGLKWYSAPASKPVKARPIAVDRGVTGTVWRRARRWNTHRSTGDPLKPKEKIPFENPRSYCANPAAASSCRSSPKCSVAPVVNTRTVSVVRPTEKMLLVDTLLLNSWPVSESVLFPIGMPIRAPAEVSWIPSVSLYSEKGNWTSIFDHSGTRSRRYSYP